jgi:hypothetical protein
MYTINVSFKDILRIGTADSSFSVIWTGLVHDYVHGFLQFFDHTPLSFNQRAFPFVHGSMDLSPLPVPSSCRSPVTEPTSFAGPPFIPVTSNSKIWEEFDKKIKELTAESNPTATSTIELGKYIVELTLPKTGDPMHWWNDGKALYPRLYTVVKKKLCCCCHLSSM